MGTYEISTYGVMEGMMLSKRLGPKMSHNNVFSHPRDSFGSVSQLHSYIIEFLRTDTCQWSLKIILGYVYSPCYIETDAKKGNWPKSWLIIKIHNFYPIKMKFRQFYILMSWSFWQSSSLIGSKLWIFIISLLYVQ